MFKLGTFASHAGVVLDWKIECDDLTDADLAALAYVISRQVTFGRVYGIPRGGTRLARALMTYKTSGPRLLVDDVLTTGASMTAERQEGDIGVVIFARGPCPPWVTPIFQLRQRMFKQAQGIELSYALFITALIVSTAVGFYVGRYL